MGYIIHIGNDINWKIKTKMKGRDWINTLRVDGRWRWHIRVNEYSEMINGVNYKEHLLEKEWDSLTNFLTSSFSWYDTPEGVLYWAELCAIQQKPMMPHKQIKKYQFI